MLKDLRVILPIALVLLLGLGLFLGTSKPWPPGVTDVQQFFEEHHEEIENILSKMEQDELDALDWAAILGIVEPLRDPEDPPISYEEYRALLEPFGYTISHIFRSEESEQVGLARYRVKAKVYDATFVRRERNETTRECHRSLDVIDMGSCHIPGEGEWHIHYQWGF